jgi:hypothetical protein
MDSNIARRLALYELLSMPDPPDIHRGNTFRLEGKPNRHDCLPLLAAAFAREKLLEIRSRTSERARDN